MKRNSFKAVSIFATLLSVTFTPAAHGSAEERLTLDNIIATARENNGELKALREEKGIGEADQMRAALRPNPVLELDAATGALTGSSSENRLSVGVSQEFFTAGKREKRLAVTQSALGAFDANLKERERQLLLDVKLGFFDLLLAESRLDLARKSYELNRQLLQIASERFAAGDVAELDVNLAKVETGRSAAEIIEAERELVPARLQLLSFMGAPLSADLNVAGSWEQVPVSTTPVELKALALENRPDLKALESERGKSDAELALAQAGRVPDFTAGVSFSVENSETSLGGLEESDTEYLIGVNLSVPIPLFDKNQAGVKEALARKSSLESRRQFAKTTVEREVEAAVARLAASERAVDLYSKEIIPQLTQNLQLVQEAYRLGEIGMVAVIEEQKKFQEVRQNHISALHGRSAAWARLEAAVGVELNQIGGKQ